MSTRRTHDAAPTVRVGSPAELLQAVPYLLGFHPQDSLVVVGLHHRMLVATMRIDLRALVAADGRQVLDGALAALGRGGASEFIAAVYDDALPLEAGIATALAWLRPALEVPELAGGCALLDLLLVSRGRWRSIECHTPGCCPAEGQALPSAPTAFAAAATYAGVVALPDRASLAASLDPLPAADRAALQPLIADAESATVAAILSHRIKTHDRALIRELCAAARASDTPGWPDSGPEAGEVDTPDVAQLDRATLARFGVALTRLEVRDPVWLEIDDGTIDGRELWRHLARRLPSPYDAPALFLFGWRSWRDGNGALANIAAERAVASDADYSAGRLLLTALGGGVDPRHLPALRPSRATARRRAGAPVSAVRRRR